MTKVTSEGFDSSLPPPLMAAPLEFQEWSKSQLLAEQALSVPTEPLFHYTGEASLKSILGNQRLRCFSHLHQSDKHEFEFSLEVARRVIREVGQSDDRITQYFCDCLDDLLETNKLASPFDFYLFSLSHHRDDMQQWQEYGQSGRGFAIGFGPALFQPTQTEPYEQANENVFVGRVIYGEEPTAARHRRIVTKAAQTTSRVAWANKSLVHQVKPSEYLVTMAHELIASQLIWNCLTAKEVRYENEREVRCIVMNVRKNFDSHRQFQPDTDRQYIETPMPLKNLRNITEILIGPRAPPGTEAMVAEFLKTQGYSNTVTVNRSQF